MVPEIDWLRAPKPDFDFPDFDEADRLVTAADGERRLMILIALRTGPAGRASRVALGRLGSEEGTSTRESVSQVRPRNRAEERQGSRDSAGEVSRMN